LIRPGSAADGPDAASANCRAIDVEFESTQTPKIGSDRTGNSLGALQKTLRNQFGLL
jgi:hypothetical protein